MTAEIERLAAWYRQQCDGDWEHQHGVKLVTIDNPGWSLDVNVNETPAAGTPAAPTNIERSEDDWLFFELKDDLFRGRCGPNNLVEMIGAFLHLVETHES
jgi:hypothetical protein